jgi:hypothetical protein
LLAEQLAQDIEDSSAERLTLQFNLFEQALVYVPLASLVREKIPQMAGGQGLSDSAKYFIRH